MDHTAGKRPAVGLRRRAHRDGRAGNARQPGARLPAETPRHPAETPRRTPAETPRRLRRKRAAPAGRETSWPPGGNAWHPAGNMRRPYGKRAVPAGCKCGRSSPARSKAAGQRPFRRNAQQAGRPPLNACRAAGRASVPDLTPLSPGRTDSSRASTRQYVGGRTGRTAAQLGRAGRTDPAAHFQITSSEIANTCSQHWKRRLSIHLQASYLNVISSLPLNGRHIRSPPQPWPPRPPGGTASAGSNRLYYISAGQKTGDMKCPRSGSNRHWGPF